MKSVEDIAGRIEEITSAHGVGALAEKASAVEEMLKDLDVAEEEEKSGLVQQEDHLS